MKKTLLVAIAMFACAGLQAQTNPGAIATTVAERRAQQAAFQVVSPFTLAAPKAARDILITDVVDNATIMTANPASLAQILSLRPENLEFTFSAMEGEVVLELFRVNPFSDDFSVVTSDTDQPFAWTPGAYYRGIVKGQPASLVSISVFKDEVMGFVSDASGEHTLGKIEGSADEHIWYNTRDFKGELETGCATPDDGVGYTADQIAFMGGEKTVNCLNLYWEVNYDIFQGKGSVTNATNYVTGLYNQSATIYNNDGISTLLSQVFVWNTTSPYTSTSTSTLLSQFQNYRNSFNGNLGHLLGYAGGGGIAAGFTGICNSNLDNSMCYSGIQSSYSTVPTYSWSVMVVTHEQGHLMGSRHTHACVWNGNNTAIDGCGQQAGYSEGSCATGPIPSAGGTIMSYCHLNAVGINFNNGFGTQPKNVIVNNINNGTCLTACGGTTCGTPGSLAAGSITTSSAALTWGGVSGATTYNLQWKLNSGTTWTTITGLTSASYSLTGLAANTAYNFKVQAVCPAGSSSYSAANTFTTLPTGGCPDVLEPNNTFATAAAITLPATVNALVASSTDVDHYKFTTTATANISITLGNLAGDYDLQLLNSAGTQVAISQAGGTTSEAITYNNAAAGTWTVYVYGYGGAFSATQCYALGVSAAAVACTDAYEPNNSVSQYYTISANTTRTALISSSTDQDWFRFANTTAQKNIRVQLTSLPADYDLRLYRSSTYLAVSQNSGTTNEQIIYNTSTVSSNYKANVYGYNGAFNASTCYTLTVSISSTAFLPGGNLEQTLADDGSWKDAAFAVYPNPANDLVTVILPAGDEMTRLELIDALGQVTIATEQRNAGGDMRIQLDVRDLGVGVYLVRVTRGNRVDVQRVVVSR